MDNKVKNHTGKGLLARELKKQLSIITTNAYNDYQTLTIEETNIPGLNEIINAAKITVFSKGGRRIDLYTNMKKKWCTKISSLIREQNISHIDKLFMHVIWYEPNMKRDPDNIASFIKFILDSMVTSKVINNDGWKTVKGWYNSFIVSPPRRVEVRLYETKL